jgi:hypothetical protein
MRALGLAVEASGRGRSDSGSDLPAPTPEGWRVVCPLAVARRALGADAVEAVPEVEDGGWMYLDLAGPDGAAGAGDRWVDRIRERAADHCVFATDYF